MIVGELSKVEALIAEARKAAQGDDLAAITRAVDALQQASHKLAEELYTGSNGSTGPTGSTGSAGSTGSGSTSADVVDGEVVDAA